MKFKVVSLILIIFLFTSCLFSPTSNKKDIWVLKTLNWYNTFGEISEAYVYSLDSLVLIEQLMGAEHPKRKYTYDEHGNILEEIVYNSDGSQHSRWANSYWEYKQDVFVRRSAYLYNENDSLRDTYDYDLVADTLKRIRRIDDFECYDHFYILDEHGNVIELIEYAASGTMYAREVRTVQELVNGVFVPKRTDYYNKRNEYIYSDIHTLEGLVLSSTYGDGGIDRELSYDEYGNKIMLKSGGKLLITSTYQKLVKNE